MTPLSIYLLVINVIAFLMMATDKFKAIYHKRRISESALFAPIIIGGSLGGLFGMYIFNHKTRHTKFLIGIPVIALIHIILFILYFKYCL